MDLNMVTYSIYEAKEWFSEVIRRVGSGQTVVISHRGAPVAEVRPIKNHPATIEERLKDLEERGILVRQAGPRAFLTPLAHQPGALQRFLDERHK
ncbi:MAG: type II toxin-antitoxin system prevent-host-death family antitoxin [Acidimicrobiia bacterium]|nr:type II toxin-antitoxin system prevent-host-death family antitoxin [Acidimicrobiia bacterium]MYH54989.1 type II toxin-antitoxin system prevent-host-death family antitoxin [Acidimicrobiia bacterium]